ncbi:hypothetical protein SARC_11950 [Sphaeroforma arctica JP610]|uniref:Enhancer of polycomb-like protein n=1 Tax=Sphaeroforma arctica JP610 TaxID=667725 RepID=A0A0L0FFI4_9EUKA|nr:hypothetical protein SARC_11950 [Sphaeroforma arctica JP610]KNC75529.1 hypothetical protein SARC_11950 [Sphaeroforma arctica JP610]|eukprot:XP_014149431.1 hypothetical protein SARC_11950 [Sphaeroforma arctica JP610]
MMSIPIPETDEKVEDTDEIYGKAPKISSHYIRIMDRYLITDRVLYDADSDDERWVENFNTTHQSSSRSVSIDEFERLFDLLEKSSPYEELIEYGEAKNLLNCEDLIVKAVYQLWKDKRRARMSKPLRPTIKFDPHNDPDLAHDPYVAFRRRSERHRIKTRKHQKQDESNYDKMLKLRRDLDKALVLLDLVKKRERLKAESVRHAKECLQKRYELNDWSDRLFLPETGGPDIADLSPSPTTIKKIRTGHKKDRESSKRKHKEGPRLPVAESDIEEVKPSLLKIKLHKPSENPYVVRKIKGISFSVGRGLGCPTAIKSPAVAFGYTPLKGMPNVRCARRRIGRGGRVLFDRTPTWAAEQFSADPKYIDPFVRHGPFENLVRRQTSSVATPQMTNSILKMSAVVDHRIPGPVRPAGPIGTTQVQSQNINSNSNSISYSTKQSHPLTAQQQQAYPHTSAQRVEHSGANSAQNQALGGATHSLTTSSAPSDQQPVQTQRLATTQNTADQLNSSYTLPTGQRPTTALLANSGVGGSSSTNTNTTTNTNLSSNTNPISNPITTAKLMASTKSCTITNATSAAASSVPQSASSVSQVQPGHIGTQLGGVSSLASTTPAVGAYSSTSTSAGQSASRIPSSNVYSQPYATTLVNRPIPQDQENTTADGYDSAPTMSAVDGTVRGQSLTQAQATSTADANLNPNQATFNHGGSATKMSSDTPMTTTAASQPVDSQSYAALSAQRAQPQQQQQQQQLHGNHVNNLNATSNAATSVPYNSISQIPSMNNSTYTSRQSSFGETCSDGSQPQRTASRSAVAAVASSVPSMSQSAM